MNINNFCKQFDNWFSILETWNPFVLCKEAKVVQNFSNQNKIIHNLQWNKLQAVYIESKFIIIKWMNNE